ncbi:FCS-Like Zinc finger 15-like [Benincasa hispida]|uniref:FCS-Like Zinc finger 15-like n=1 Tax=Benincasa hispida TaxID=102211 RepID=UPI0019003551|nr:FCS-Like Zinc finger 15-like [Benincasa hispida]
MVGLSIILETRKLDIVTESTRQVIDKTTLMMINNNHHRRRRHHSASSSKTPTFLDRCFLCAQKLLPGKDIYMYEGDKGFCSEECRCRQIFMDEEETMVDAGNCSFAAAINPQQTTAPSPSPPPSRLPKPTKNHSPGIAY